MSISSSDQPTNTIIVPSSSLLKISHLLAGRRASATSDNVATVRRGLKEQLFPEFKFSKAFKDSELPALMVVAADTEKTSTQDTTCTIEHYVPVKVFIVARNDVPAVSAYSEPVSRCR